MGVGLAIQGVCTQRKNEARSGARKACVASLVPEAPPAIAVTWCWDSKGSQQRSTYYLTTYTAVMIIRGAIRGTSSKPKLAASAAGVRSCLTSLSATYISM